MTRQVLIAGGGIGGLAAALAAFRAGWEVRLYEQTGAFAELGAGLQLGPNATRILQSWGLGSALDAVAAFPEFLRVCRAQDGSELGRLPLGERSRERYGAPYATLHRADLHALLLSSLEGRSLVHLNLNARVNGFLDTPEGVQLSLPDGHRVEGDALVAADGLWSALRPQALGDESPRLTGHLAYRALLKQADLPAALRRQNVQVWLGPRMHAVAYPVRRGELLNLVVFVEGPVPEEHCEWDQTAWAEDVQAALAEQCSDLRGLVEAAPSWRLWALSDRPPLHSPEQMATGRVALLGDAAHPMLPYLAQGAGMAIEDAAELGVCLATVARPSSDVPLALRRYAVQRWQRNARVQARARRNSEIFHATGFMRWGRDVSLRLLGARLLDMPWLYGHGQLQAAQPAFKPLPANAGGKPE